MTTTIQAGELPTLTITEEIFVRASIDATFASLLENLGPLNQTEGKLLSMRLEAKPGGRWYRDLGGDNGHLWGFVQSIKRPVLLELWGPLFISTATANNLIYRLSETDGGTLISFKHTLLGSVPEDFEEKMPLGWQAIHARVKQNAER